MNLKEYASNLISQFKDLRVVKNVENLLEKIKEKKSLKIWATSDDKREYERSKRVLDGSLKSVLDDKKIRASLKENSVKSLIKNDYLILIHDPCDLRKENSEEMERLGKVRALDGEIINGYSSFNTVVVNEKGLNLKLLDTEFYSNRDENYVKSVEVKSSKKLDTPRAKKVKELITEDKHINLSKITYNQLKSSSEALKSEKLEIILCHVLDRGFDCNDYFRFIKENLNDYFVIRLKISRISNDGITKLSEINFSKTAKFYRDKVMIRNKVYHDACCIIEWNKHLIDNKEYKVVRVTIIDRNGKIIFKNPMLLMTNLEIENEIQAYLVYKTYLMRAKIEGVFKFLKNELGWEDFQVRDYETIKNIVTLAYFICGYFYEIEEVVVENEYIKWLAKLGKGKGKVTKQFILAGLKKVYAAQEVQNFIIENNITKEQFKEMLSYATF